MNVSLAPVDILIPTFNRVNSFIMGLSGITAQARPGLRVVVADQSRQPVSEDPVVVVLSRIIEARGGAIEIHKRGEFYGIAEQRHYLLAQAGAGYVLYHDDDVWMEPEVVGRLLSVIQSEECAFVGAFPSSLSFLEDVRPDQQGTIEYWDGPVRPETVEPESPAWERWNVHRAANPYHIAQRLPPGEVRRYKIAWVGACVMYDRSKLEAVGGFSFWPRLPRYHSGEEALVQNVLMRLWGGCAILPAGTYFADLPSSVLNEKQTVDGHALELLPEMVARYAGPTFTTGK